MKERKKLIFYLTSWKLLTSELQYNAEQFAPFSD